MALKIRLRQQGRTNRASYRLVVTDSRNPRDGKYVEAIGWYNPIESEPEKMLSFKEDRVQHWIGLGAQMTERAANLIATRSPTILREQTEKEVAKRAKRLEKRKARAKAKA